MADGAQCQQSQSRHGISIAGRLAGFWIVEGPVDLLHFLDKARPPIHGNIHAVLLRRCTRSGPATDRHSTHAQQPLASVQDYSTHFSCAGGVALRRPRSPMIRK